ncbi:MULTISPECIES: protein-export chaperone SecB [Lysobacter]|jgi:preprotein translocase subunit SecB|uniref:Protein-export protein SecB n=1 Tax=Lysobacter soli TaxID=453783 RepID=A0A3D8VAB5_9GAMM|nr:protein-export chaperone SecB [Lysobacter soli]MDG2517743.1 protein-export chaperone SecB [Lysobacter soli]QGW66666.1 protein-export chaperone SecB [Lysobacter soli]RDY66377.1 protein-export chaperone SecB [Lysobacter soli]UTA54841.1 protein-export chaperone SecB [Lysobacter soli]
MSEENVNGNAASAETNGPAFTVEKIYVKDVSFEVPGGPAIFNEQAQPQLQMNLNQSVQRLNDNAFEVVLGITLTCSANEKTLYVAEVKQAGVFGLAGFDAQTLDAMLGTHCPNVLYPYTRQLISDLIQAGGFPPFYLQPINFDALYAEGLRQRAAQQQSGLADAETAGNA